jgi:hypothetical protein
MKCMRCGDELPSDTPICRRCGPPTFGSSPWASSLSSLPLSSASDPAPLPVVPGVPPAALGLPSAPPLLVEAAAAAAPVPAAALPGPVVSKPAAPAPAARAKLTKQQKKERARQRLAERGLLEPEAKFTDRGRPDAGTARDEKPSVPAAERWSPERFAVPPAVKFLSRVDRVMAAACLLTAGGMALGIPAAHAVTVAGGHHGIPVLVFLGLGFVAAASGLNGLHPYGRWAQLGLCGLSILLGGLTVLAAILIAIPLLRPGVALLMSGRPPRALSGEERKQVLDHEPALMVLWVAGVIQILSLLYRVTPLLLM